MFTDYLIKKFVHLPATYSISGLIFDILERQESEAFKQWVHFLLKTYRDAYQRKMPVIWINAFTPSEIVYGLGGIPVLPEIISAIVAYLGQSSKPIAHANTYLSTDTCSFYRCVLGLVIDDWLPRPDLIISSSHLCDGANKFFTWLARLIGCPHLFIDPPYWCDERAKGWLISQLKEVIGRASKIIGIPLSRDRMARSIELSKETRHYIKKVNRLRQAVPAPFSAKDGLSYVNGMNFHSLGSMEGLLFYKALYREIKQRVEKGEGYIKEERCRLVWLHHIRPYYKNEIFDIFDKAGAAVPFEEMSYLYWGDLDPDRPIESLAEKILSSIWAGPLERRTNAILDIIKDYKIDGAIHFSHWGCRQSCGGAGIIGDILKEKNTPYLIVPGDGGDPQNYSPGQTRTRLEAFLELLI